MPEYKSRINIKIEKICDWDKLLDIKIKEEWKLAKNAENIFREAYYRGGFIKQVTGLLILKVWKIWLNVLQKQ